LSSRRALRSAWLGGGCVQLPRRRSDDRFGERASDDENKINFEDLAMFAINYSPVTSVVATHARPGAAQSDAVTLAVPALPAVGEEIAVRVDFTGTGRMQALSVALTWDPAVVEPVGYTAGDMVLDQGGLVLQDEPGTVDGASFAGPGTGLGGQRRVRDAAVPGEGRG
jgi:hypothetical protein